MRRTSGRSTRKKGDREIMEEDLSYMDHSKLNGENILPSIKIDLKFRNEKQKRLVQSIKHNIVTICAGSPGTGKTFLSCYQSLLELKNSKDIKRIVIIKSVTTLEEEGMGYLKGDLAEKMEPVLYSFIYNFEKLIGKDKTKILREHDMIEASPLAYIRGISIDNAIIIIDELQNISIKNLRTILSRLGENSKMVFLGDVNQIDMKNRKESALRFMIDNFSDLDDVGVIEFTKEDIVRHPLITKFEEIFEDKLDKKL